MCISAVGSTLSRLSVNENIDRVEMVTILSDVGKMLVDVQRDETLTRRLLLLSNLNPTMKEALSATKPGEWLFGKDVTETLKTAKSLEKSSQDLKITTKSTPSLGFKNPINSKGPTRQMNSQPTGPGGHRKLFTQQSNNSNRQRYTRRPTQGYNNYRTNHNNSQKPR